MGFVQASHLISKGESGGEQRIGRRNHAVAVIDCVRRRKRILLPQIVIRAHGPEVFVDRILGIVEGLGDSRGYGGTIGSRPQRQIFQHRLVDAGGICNGTQIRDRANAGGRQALPVSFIVSE